VSCNGEGRNRAGGLAFLWKECIKVEVLSFSLHHIDVLIPMEDREESWRCTGIYEYSESHLKHNL